MPVVHRLRDAEQALAGALIQQASVAAQVYDGDYRAAWLLSPSIHCEVWSLRRNDGQTRLVDGVIVGDRKFDWRIRLPTGLLLTDPQHAAFLRSMQRIAFLARAMPGGPDTLTTHLNFLWSLTLFARWIFLREASLRPNVHGFARLTHDHFCDLVRDLADGGVSSALQCPQRFLRFVYPAAVGRDPTTAELGSPLALDDSDCKKVGAWLLRSGYLVKRHRAREQPASIKLKNIADALGTDVRSITNPRFVVFLTQFTAGPIEVNGAVLRGNSDTRREYASHRSATARELAQRPASEKTVHKYLTDLRTLAALHRHLPEACPPPCEFRQRQLHALVARSCRLAQATPWVPMKIALQYTTESLRWIHVYGAPLVDVFLSTYAKLFSAGLLGPPPIGSDAQKVAAYKATTAARDAIVSSVRVPEELEPLHMHGWQSYVHLDGDAGFSKLRQAPSMLDAVMVLIGSIMVVTASMKPMRESELRHLGRGCISFSSGDGYWLSAKQGKRSVAGVSPELRRPIPAIVARGLLLAQQLTDGLKKIIGVEDEWLLSSLFAMPTLSRYEAKIDSVMSTMQLNQLLDTFCDRVAIPPDSLGRRWYIRVHELRKSFLIVFFWTYRHANLRAAAWMAGHTDVSQLYAYLQANFPGQELPALEAEYASRVLRSQGEGFAAAELDNVEVLHEAVCRNFKVQDVSWIDERALQAWLATRFASGDFEIRPYSLHVRGGEAEVHIAFRLRGS